MIPINCDMKSIGHHGQTSARHMGPHGLRRYIAVIALSCWSVSLTAVGQSGVIPTPTQSPNVSVYSRQNPQSDAISANDRELAQAVPYKPCASSNVGGSGTPVPNGLFTVTVNGTANSAAICDLPTLDASGNPADDYWLEVQDDTTQLLECTATMWIENADGTETSAYGGTNMSPGVTSLVVSVGPEDNTIGINVGLTVPTIQCAVSSVGGGGSSGGGGGGGSSGGGGGSSGGGASFSLNMSGALSFQDTWNPNNIDQSTAALSIATITETLLSAGAECVPPDVFLVFSTSPYQSGQLGEAGYLGQSGWVPFILVNSNVCSTISGNPLVFSPYAGQVQTCVNVDIECTLPPPGTYYVSIVLATAYLPPAIPCGSGVIDVLPAVGLAGFGAGSVCEWQIFNASTQLTVPASTPNASVSLTPGMTMVTVGTGVTLTWASVDTSSCTASGGSSNDGWIGSLATSGSQVVTEQVAGSYTYGLSCQAGSQIVAASANVTVQAATSGSGGSGGSGGTGGGSPPTATGSSSGGGGAIDLLDILVLALAASLSLRSRVKRLTLRRR